MKLLVISAVITSAVCVAWLALSAALVGWGMLLRRAYRVSPPPNADALFDSLWTGLALVLTYVMLVNFAWRIDSAVLTVALAIGFGSCWWNRHTIRDAIASEAKRHRWPVALGIVVTVAWAANHVLGMNTFYDSGMYHVGTVEWANLFPVVPGLGNLHDRFAFNSASLLFAALLDAGPLDRLSSHLMNGFLLCLLAVYAILAASRFRHDEDRRTSDLLAFVLLPVAVLSFLGKDARSLSTDTPAMIFVVVVALRLVRILERPEPNAQDRAYAVASVLLLLAAAVTTKLSTIAFAAASVPLVILAWRLSPGATQTWKPLVVAFVLPVVMGLTWMARGVMLSGYPAYPLAMGGVSVPWKVPEEQARAAAAWIATSARGLNDGRVELGTHSVGVWSKFLIDREDLFLYVPLPLIIIVSAGVAAFIIGGFRTSQRQQRVWLLSIPVAGSILFWALSAPHPRFAVPYFWLGAGLAVALLYDGLVRRGPSAERSARFALPTLAVVLSISFVVGTFISRVRRTDLSLAERLEPALMVTWWDRFQDPFNAPNLEQFKTTSGLVLHVPRVNNLCWRGPLLCTPHPAENLRLRQPGDLSRGFRVDGQWDARRWPNPWTPFLSYWRCVHRAGAPDGKQYERRCLQEAKKDSVITASPT
jgi:hypothetical protein